jgi:Subtilase family
MTRRLLLSLVTCVICAAVAAGSSVAAEIPFPPAQLRNDRGEQLPFVDPPAHTAGLCIIDSGVTLNPDLESVVVDREALDGGTPNDVDPMMHGTRMAMEAAAVPGNEWGTVGAAPASVRIVSIRVMDTDGTVSFNAYKQAILRCRTLSATYNIKVISLSLGYPSAPNEQELQELENAVISAQSYGVVVVAASGNEGAGELDYPAALASVIAVGASGAPGDRCPFSNFGPGLTLMAPGCDLETADPITGNASNGFFGTSQAAADTAAVLAGLDAYRPDLTPADDKQLLTTTAQSNGGSLNVQSLFQAAGLGALLETAREREPNALTGPIALQSSPAPVALVPLLVRDTPLPRPRIRVERRQAHLIIKALNRPRGALMAVTVARKSGRLRGLTLAQRHISASSLVLKPYHQVMLAVHYLAGATHLDSSPTTRISVR